MHLVFTRKGSLDATYINGTLLDADYSVNLKSDAALNMQHNWYIGCYSGNNPYYSANNTTQYKYQGLLDNLRLYNRALTTDEIQFLYREMN